MKSRDDDNKAEAAAAAPESPPVPAPSKQPGLEERIAKLEQTMEKLMPRIEALTGPLA